MGLKLCKTQFYTLFLEINCLISIGPVCGSIEHVSKWGKSRYLAITIELKFDVSQLEMTMTIYISCFKK